MEQRKIGKKGRKKTGREEGMREGRGREGKERKMVISKVAFNDQHLLMFTPWAISF